MKVFKFFLISFVLYSCTDTIDIDVNRKYDEAMSLYADGNYSDAMVKLELVFSQIESSNSELEVKALYLRGFIYYLQDNNKAAYKDYLKAIEVANIIDDRLRVSKLYNEVGQIFYESELYDQALLHFQEALKLADYATKQDVANYNYGVGKSLKMIGRVEEGVSYLLKSMDFNISLNNHRALVGDYNEMAIAQRMAGNYDQAIELYRKNEKLVSLMQNSSYYSWQLYNNMGNVFLESGDIANAESYLLKSLEFKSDAAHLWITYNNLGKVYNNKGEYETAWKYFKQSLKYNGENGEMNELAITNQALKKTFEKLDQPDSLLYYTMLINDMALPMIQNQSWLKDEEEKIALLTKYQDHEREKAEKEQYAKTSWLMAFIMTFIFMSGVLSVKLWKIYHYKSAEKGLALIKNSNEMVYLLDMFRKEKEEMKRSMDQKIRN